MTCICSKLLEHIIWHHIREHLDNLSILSVFQHGFRSGHSCFYQLLVTVHDFMTAFHRGIQTDVSVIDFSKAFHMVPHRRPLGKLKHCGITGPTLNWISEFLSGRTQCVIGAGAESSWISVTSGMPQGTVLGNLSFLLYINDLPDCVSSSVWLFADDCLLYRRVTSVDDQLELQNDLTRLEEWTLTWGIKFNLSKCTILSVSRSRTPLAKFYSLCGVLLSLANEAKYLGVSLSWDMEWAKHIQQVTNSCSSTIALLHRNLSGCPVQLREKAYISLIRSCLEYASAIWDPHLKMLINGPEAIQSRAIQRKDGEILDSLYFSKSSRVKWRFLWRIFPTGQTPGPGAATTGKILTITHQLYPIPPLIFLIYHPRVE